MYVSYSIEYTSMWFLYILLCSDRTLYTGITNNLKKRFSEHKSGQGGRYTRSHKPIKLIYQEKMSSQSEALRRESQIKSWKRAEKITALKLVLDG